MRSLWKIDDVDAFGASINLLGYPNLERLFFTCEPRLGSRHYRGSPPRLVTFDSRLISHLDKLQVLSLRGYHTVDLLSLPLSLQVAPAWPSFLLLQWLLSFQMTSVIKGPIEAWTDFDALACRILKVAVHMLALVRVL